MSSIGMTKYKDELPANTINKIRNILHSLGLLTIETSWNNSAADFFSVRVNIAGTNLGTNGKGATREYALASVYGELMERLQNQAFFRLNADFAQDTMEYQGFFYAPDEKAISIEELLNSKEDWITTQLSFVDSSIDKLELLKKWQAVSYEKTPADFIALPYYNLKKNTISHIPIKMITKMYMSNGMCAGNSYEEALVQGLSEVLERNANIRIIKEKMTPPDFPREYLERFPRICRMIEQIEASGNFKVILKDCSLGEGFPVVGVIFIDKDTQNYFVKFGSHPVFQIAAERTLTELLQGQDVKNMMGLKEFIYKNPVAEEPDNLIGILVNGSGYYPAQFFSTNFTYEFKELSDVSELSNKEMLKYLVELVHNKGFDIYVRDVSFLGFPSFHIVVPGLSEIEQIYDMKAIEDYAEYNQAKRHIRNLSNKTRAEIDEIINFLNKFDHNVESPVLRLLNLSIQDSMPWYYSGVHLLLTALHYKNGNLMQACKSFNKYLSNMMQVSPGDQSVTFFKCIRDYLGARVDNLDQAEIIDQLSTIYSSQMVAGVIEEFADQDSIVNKYGQFKCWDCEQCDFKNSCQYKAIDQVYRTLKEKYAVTKINQADLKTLLNV